MAPVLGTLAHVAAVRAYSGVAYRDSVLAVGAMDAVVGALNRHGADVVVARAALGAVNRFVSGSPTVAIEVARTAASCLARFATHGDADVSQNVMFGLRNIVSAHGTAGADLVFNAVRGVSGAWPAILSRGDRGHRSLVADVTLKGSRETTWGMVEMGVLHALDDGVLSKLLSARRGAPESTLAAYREAAPRLMRRCAEDFSRHGFVGGGVRRLLALVLASDVTSVELVRETLEKDAALRALLVSAVGEERFVKSVARDLLDAALERGAVDERDLERWRRGYYYY